MTQRIRTGIVVGVLSAVLAAGSAAAQDRLPRGRGGLGRGAPGPLQDGVSPAEIQQLFDAYAIMQAQQELQLSDDQFGSFLSRVRALQEVRRRGQMERFRVLQELRRLSPSGSDDQIKGALERLHDLERKNADEVAEAIGKVDDVLNLRQRARFRLLEEQMERRKLDLLMRARQQNRAREQF